MPDENPRSRWSRRDEEQAKEDERLRLEALAIGAGHEPEGMKVDRRYSGIDTDDIAARIIKASKLKKEKERESEAPSRFSKLSKVMDDTRAMGEVGVLTEDDVKRYTDSQTLDKKMTDYQRSLPQKLDTEQVSDMGQEIAQAQERGEELTEKQKKWQRERQHTNFPENN
jgi:hypothetical protein